MKIIKAPYINQGDKFPTGCESVSAVMLLQYLGYSITVEEFIADYLEKEAGLQRAVRLSGSGCYFHDCICSDHRSVQSGASYHQ